VKELKILVNRNRSVKILFIDLKIVNLRMYLNQLGYIETYTFGCALFVGWIFTLEKYY